MAVTSNHVMQAAFADIIQQNQQLTDDFFDCRN